MAQLLFNFGYVIMFLALLVRDILWLRIILMSAQLVLFSYGIITENYSIIFWNILFFSINAFQVLQLFSERRPIELPAEIVDIYENIFSTMSSREFLNFWNMGSIRNMENQQLIKANSIQESLFLLISGKVSVKNSGKLIAKLERGSFLAEMSFLTGNPSTADVFADGKISYIYWEQEKLNDLKKIDVHLFVKLQNILGKDLTEKVKVVTKKQVQNS